MLAALGKTTGDRGIFSGLKSTGDLFVGWLAVRWRAAQPTLC